MYFIERKVNPDEDYAYFSVKTTQYNAKELVNKGNCLFIKSNLKRPQKRYLEAVGIQADFVQAVYNLDLANVRLDITEEASQAFEKLPTVAPNDILLSTR